MANCNCLAGMACPKCGSGGPFDIHAVVCCATVGDDGVHETWDHEWEDDDVTVCRACAHVGTVRTFSLGKTAHDLETASRN